MNKSTIFHRTIFLLLIVVFCLGQAEARTWYVKPDGSGDAPTIQAAIFQATDWDTILVAAGLYTGSDNKNISYMEKVLVVRSESGPRVTIIDCEGEGRGFNFYYGETGASKVAGFTIVNGYVAGDNGGGIDCKMSSSPIISNCILRGNRVDGYGGGISCSNGCSPVISGCAIIKNRASSGGGIYCEQNSSPEISNCVIAEDSARTGGGVLLVGGQPKLSGCVIVWNQALFGGGIACNISSPEITRCTIVGNRAAFGGGGISCVNSFPHLGGSPPNRNSIYNNQAGQAGENLRTNSPINIAQYNFWGRIHDSSEDSLSILETMDVYTSASVNWWPISTEPRAVVQKVQAVADTFYFPEAKIAFSPSTMNPTGDSTISVTAWPDSTPPYIPGGDPVEKWFEIVAGSGIGDFSANLTLKYTQAEFDASDITGEEAIYCARYFQAQWSSYPGIADPEENWVQCATTELSVWAIGGPGGPLTPVPGAQDALELPGDFWLSQNYPNPFNASTSISLFLPAETPVSLRIYNVWGQQVKSLLEDHLPPGRHAIIWDGTDYQKRMVSSGLYFCRLQAGNFQQTRKLVLLR